MNRFRIAFSILVFGGLLVGFLAERRRSAQPVDALQLSEPPEPGFETLEPPIGSVVVAGKLLDDVGRPASGVEIVLFIDEPEGSAANPLHWTTTDSRGAFEFDQLREGRYGAILQQPGRRPEQMKLEVPHEGELTWRLELPPLTSLEALPALERSPLSGRIEVRPGRSPENFEVLLVPLEDDPMLLTGALRRRALVGPEGTFELEGLVEAAYRVELIPPWARSGSWPALDTLTIDHRSPRDDLVLRDRSGALTGRITDLDGAPIRGVLVQCYQVAGDSTNLWPATSSSEAGEFEVLDLPAGDYVLRLHGGQASREIEVGVEAGVVRRVVVDAFEP